MKFSEARLSYLAHRVLAILQKEGGAQVENERLVLAEIKKALGEGQARDARMDAEVKRKIASLSRNVPPGSREWDVLYRKYYAEESEKQKS